MDLIFIIIGIIVVIIFLNIIIEIILLPIEFIITLFQKIFRSNRITEPPSTDSSAFRIDKYSKVAPNELPEETSFIFQSKR